MVECIAIWGAFRDTFHITHCSAFLEISRITGHTREMIEGLKRDNWRLRVIINADPQY